MSKDPKVDPSEKATDLDYDPLNDCSPIDPTDLWMLGLAEKQAQRAAPSRNENAEVPMPLDPDLTDSELLQCIEEQKKNPFVD